MQDYRININYAKALFLLAGETGQQEEVAKDMRLVNSVCAENRELNVVFNNPVIKEARKVAILTDLFGERVSKITTLFFNFVVRMHRTVNLRGISDAYLEMYRDANGIVMSDLVTHQPIDENAREMVTRMVAEYTGKTVELHDRTDEKMLGSFKLEFDNHNCDENGNRIMPFGVFKNKLIKEGAIE